MFYRRRRQRRGAAAVEMALVTPFLLLLVFGIIEFGQVFYVQLVLTNASREGARDACLDGADLQSAQAATTRYLESFGLDNADIDISPDPSDLGFRDPVTVTVSLNFKNASWLGAPMFVGGDLKASSTMRSDSSQ